MYTYSEVVELGKAQSVIMGTKVIDNEDGAANSALAADEFDD